MSTTGTKRIAQNVASNTGITYQAARARVSEAIIELDIDRIKYNENLRNWEISTADAEMLTDHLTEQINFS